MNNTNIRDLGQVRDVLAEWEKVRQQLIAGTVVGFHAALIEPSGDETIYIGGIYKGHPEAAARAALRASMARMLKDEDVDLFQSVRL
jgi:hypothetical protein